MPGGIASGDDLTRVSQRRPSRPRRGAEGVGDGGDVRPPVDALDETVKQYQGMHKALINMSQARHQWGDYFYTVSQYRGRVTTTLVAGRIVYEVGGTS